MRRRWGTPRRTPRKLRRAVVVIGLLAAAWALVSPVGSVPDEPSHVIYAAAVVRGDLGSGPTGHVVRVPADIASASVVTCPAFRPQVTADCALPFAASTAEVATVTNAARYPPLYYALVGWPTLFGFNVGVWLLMRLLSVALGVLLLWLGTAAWPDDLAAPAVGLLLAATPMTMFLLGSVNPNGAEIVAGMSFALAAMGLLEWVRRRRPVPRVAAVALGATGGYLALARPSTYVLVVALGAVLAIEGGAAAWSARRQRGVVLAVVGVAVAAAVGFAYGVLDSAPAGAAPPAPIGVGAAVHRVWSLAPQLLGNTVGIFGWLDHQPPLALRGAWLAMTAALLLWALAVGTRGSRLALVMLVIGAGFIAPLFVLLTLFRDGSGYQARYAMALTQVIPILAAAVLVRAREPGPLLRRVFAQVPLITLGLGVLALGGSYLRYAVGLPLDVRHVVGDVAWVPPAWPLVLALLVAAAVVTWRLRRSLLVPWADTVLPE